jgi:sugar transferase EpsL
MSRVVGGALLILLSPVLAVIAVLVRIRMGRPVLFRQARSGLRGRSFDIVKFRTMRAERYEGEPDSDRINNLGHFLRVTSLDEVPSLVNVVRGEMVLVGPRPFIASYAQHYTEREAKRLAVKPGLTGWHQVNGRNRMSWEEKFDLDVWYVEHRTWWLDLKILARTPRALLRSTDVAHHNHATMPFFERSIDRDAQEGHEN